MNKGIENDRDDYLEQLRKVNKLNKYKRKTGNTFFKQFMVFVLYKALGYKIKDIALISGMCTKNVYRIIPLLENYEENKILMSYLQEQIQKDVLLDICNEINTIPMKTCPICGERKPHISKYWYIGKSNVWECKECISLKQKIDHGLTPDSVIKKCLYCGKDFSVLDNRKENHIARSDVNYCSRQCMYKGKIKQIKQKQEEYHDRITANGN